MSPLRCNKALKTEREALLLSNFGVCLSPRSLIQCVSLERDYLCYGYKSEFFEFVGA